MPQPMTAPSEVRVRLAQPADGERLSAIYAPLVRQSATSFELVPPDAAAMAARLAQATDRFPWLVAEWEHRVVGYAYGSAFRTRPAYSWCVEVSAYVDGEHRSHGVGRRLYDVLLGVLTEQGFVMAYAGITVPNVASIALHQACGFAYVGTFNRAGFKFGRWHDVAWYARPLIDPAPADPAPPRPVSAVYRDR